jgi:hypothetical protein
MILGNKNCSSQQKYYDKIWARSFFTVIITFVVTPAMLAVTAETVSGLAMMNSRGERVPPTSEVGPVVETGSGKKPVRHGSDIVEVENELALAEVEFFILLLL